MNNYIREYASTSFMKFQNGNFNVLINCDEEDKEWILNEKNAVRRDQIKFGTGGNIFDFLAPY